jgi:hypothetical protein
MKRPYAVEFGVNVTVVMATNREAAARYARLEFGRQHDYRVRAATQSDIGWVEAMGGTTHEGT